VPLFRDHRVLSQVAGHGLNVLKALPPLVIDEDDLDWFVTALDETVRPRREDARARSSASLMHAAKRPDARRGKRLARA